MAKSEKESDTQKRRRGKSWKLPPDLFFARAVQTVHDNTVQQNFPRLDQIQAEDQAGIQKLLPNNRTSCYILNDGSEMPRVENQMWAATIDFMKAFDSISHNSIWEALKSCNVGHDYISLLKKLYRDQKASVQTDEESEIFDIQARRSDVQPAVQHGTAVLIKKTKYNDGKRRKEWEFT